MTRLPSWEAPVSVERVQALLKRAGSLSPRTGDAASRRPTFSRTSVVADCCVTVHTNWVPAGRTAGAARTRWHPALLQSAWSQIKGPSAPDRRRVMSDGIYRRGSAETTAGPSEQVSHIGVDVAVYVHADEPCFAEG